MRKNTHSQVFNVIVRILTTLLIFTAMGCGGGGSDNETTGPNDQNEPDTTNTSGRLVCEEMLSAEFQSAHSMSIETDDRGNNPIAGYGEIAVYCILKKNDEWISEVTALNCNRATYDSHVAELKTLHDVVEDQSVGTKSAYTYYNEASGLLTYTFMGSNAATMVDIVNILQMSLDDTMAVATEINRNLPDVRPVEDTTEDYKCPEIISESDLSTIFGKDVTYVSPDPNNTANNLRCNFEGPVSEGSPDLSGGIDLYCKPATGQITPLQQFKVMEEQILLGYSEVAGTKLVFEDVLSLPEISQYAYYYTAGTELASFRTPFVMFIHSGTGCNVSVDAYDFSKPDLQPEMIATAEKIDDSLEIKE